VEIFTGRSAVGLRVVRDTLELVADLLAGIVALDRQID
jgi:hypothetical protein